MRQHSHPALRLKSFIAYKSVNAFFQGVWGTAYVGLMAPLPPEVFSAGGIGFSLGTSLVALAYSKLFNLFWFFRISVGVEVIALLSVIAILLYPMGFTMAAGVYLGFQLALIFGNYLVRLETLVIATDKFKPVDLGKSIGALLGLASAAGFYQWGRTWLETGDSLALIQLIHYPLLLVQLTTLWLLLVSFDRRRFDEPL
ncbi:MAG: hypothetical protein ISQ05_04840 [Pseudomonadales bacterium]|nr:hypothetical protein [Pseudomonadales bacterium]